MYAADNTASNYTITTLAKYNAFLPFIFFWNVGKATILTNPSTGVEVQQDSRRGERESQEIIESNTETTSCGSTIKTMGPRCAITAGCRGSHLDGGER